MVIRHTWSARKRSIAHRGMRPPCHHTHHTSSALAQTDERAEFGTLGPLAAVSWPWVPACGLLEPPRRDGENAQKTGKTGGKWARYGLKRVKGSGSPGIGDKLALRLVRAAALLRHLPAKFLPLRSFGGQVCRHHNQPEAQARTKGCCRATHSGRS